MFYCECFSRALFRRARPPFGFDSFQFHCIDGCRPKHMHFTSYAKPHIPGRRQHTSCDSACSTRCTLHHRWSVLSGSVGSRLTNVFYQVAVDSQQCEVWVGPLPWTFHQKPFDERFSWSPLPHAHPFVCDAFRCRSIVGCRPRQTIQCIRRVTATPSQSRSSSTHISW